MPSFVGDFVGLLGFCNQKQKAPLPRRGPATAIDHQVGEEVEALFLVEFHVSKPFARFLHLSNPKPLNL